MSIKTLLLTFNSNWRFQKKSAGCQNNDRIILSTGTSAWPFENLCLSYHRHPVAILHSARPIINDDTIPNHPLPMHCISNGFTYSYHHPFVTIIWVPRTTIPVFSCYQLTSISIQGVFVHHKACLQYHRHPGIDKIVPDLVVARPASDAVSRVVNASENVKSDTCAKVPS